MHPGQGTRTTFLSEAMALAETGVVSLLVDAPYLRPGFVPGPGRPPGAFGPDLYRQLVIDLSRGVDLLTVRPDDDPNRVGYVGHSLGATSRWPEVALGLPPLSDHVLEQVREAAPHFLWG
ncbi:MAG TPA: hypothetical protein VD969_05805 [Symbiobacteriaceae bacterium]|nr:hypothetical protein [Symbiobacteriaceae bacterium]